MKQSESSPSTGKWYDKPGLVILLLLLFFPAGLYGLWRSARISRTWKIVGTIAVVFLFIVFVSTDKHDKIAHDSDQPKTESEASDASTAATGAQTVAADAPAAKYLFASTDDFKTAFNQFSTSHNFDFSIDHLTVKEGDVQNSFQFMFTDHLGILGSVDKSGKVLDMLMMGSGDGTVESGSNMLLCMTALMGTVDPNLSTDQSKKILEGFGLLGNKQVDLSSLDDSTEVHGIRYKVSSNKVMGLMFSMARK